MNRTLVLKDAQGRAVGFAEQRGNMVNCRINAKEQDRILLFFDSGAPLVICTECGRMEYRQEVGDKAIVGAAALCQGKCMAGSGKGVQRLVGAYIDEQRTKTAEKSVMQDGDPLQRECKEVGREGGGLFWPEKAYPDRRWPPNPCCPDLGFSRPNKS